MLSLRHCKFNNIGTLLRKCRFLTKGFGYCQISYEQKPGTKKCMPFLDMINTRREQAKRSILVQVQSIESFRELYSYCNTLGTVSQAFHYTAGNEQLNFIIIEFTDETHVMNVIDNSSHFDNDQGFPVHSNFLWFKAANRKSRLKLSNCSLNTEHGNKVLTGTDIHELLQTTKLISEQVQNLYDYTKLNEVATRLRFLTTRQVELSVAGMFPRAVAYPFGSSVNGFGKMGCDLDIVLKLAPEPMVRKDSRLVFHCKAVNSYERSVTQRHMEVIGDLLQLFLPGCTQIRKILQARVPIIKYFQQFTDVECDLSMTNMSGVFMSDLLYVFGLIDTRVRPLVFTVRKWAQEVGITNTSPGRWLSNFSLTLLVLAFLQKLGTSPPVIPSINDILKQSGTTYNSLSENENKFLQNIDLPTFKSTNTDSLEVLLSQFFNYYSSFDFTTKAINLNEAIAITKPEFNALYIVNPLERGLNVSKNVSLEELEKFKYELRNASWMLESHQKGILEIFQSKKKTNSYTHFPRQERLMEVSKLFEEENGQNKDKASSENQTNSIQYHKASRLEIIELNSELCSMEISKSGSPNALLNKSLLPSEIEIIEIDDDMENYNPVYSVIDLTAVDQDELCEATASNSVSLSHSASIDNNKKLIVVDECMEIIEDFTSNDNNQLPDKFVNIKRRSRTKNNCNSGEIILGEKIMLSENCNVEENKEKSDKNVISNNKRALRKRNCNYDSENGETNKIKVKKLNNGNSVEKYYLDKKVKRLPSTLETIFEEPKKQNNEELYLSSRKLKRVLSFHEDIAHINKLKSRKRRNKAKKLPSSKSFINRKKVSMETLMNKLGNLDADD